jgi:hypothetical protein
MTGCNNKVMKCGHGMRFKIAVAGIHRRSDEPEHEHLYARRHY